MFDLRSAPALFIQPHADDVPLSCGGTAAAIAAAGHQSHIITVFAGEIVPQMVGAFAEWKHARWKLTGPDAVIETRRAEDAAAAEILGCSIRWLGMPDAIYRGDSYVSDQELFGPMRPNEIELAYHLIEELKNLPEWMPDATVFVPLGIGSHVDHQIAFEVGRGLAAHGHRVLAYEDTPYVIHSPEGRGRRLRQVGASLGDAILHGVLDLHERRLDAIAAYASQLPVIFRFTDDYRRSVSDYATTVGAGVPSERFWPVIG